MITEPSPKTEYVTKFKKQNLQPRSKGFSIDEDDTDSQKPAITKQMEPLFDPNEESLRKEKDIYCSQTHCTHHLMLPRKVESVNKIADTLPEFRVYVNRNPIDPFMRLPYRQITLPKKTLTVPHRGMITEFKEKYKPQIDMLEEVEREYKPEKIEIKRTPQEDMIKAMDLYHTEYDHIGTEWSTQNA